MNFKIVIPARYASSRLPAKPLQLIDDKPMIWHTYQRALETGVNESDIFIATDHVDIFNACNDFGANVLMTHPDHESGTDRLTEVVNTLGWDDSDVVVNVQGDEPLVPAELITLTANTLMESAAGMATVACPIHSASEVHDPNSVKVTIDINGQALDFSRAAIPYARDGFSGELFMDSNSAWLRHIGMYAYTAGTLRKITASAMAKIEQLEKLEQLRALYQGIKIQVAIVEEAPGHGVDTLADLERVRKLF